MLHNKIILIFLIYVCIILSTMSGCFSRNDSTTRLIAVRVTKINSEPIISENRFSASVREWHKIELSFKIPGTVVSLLQVPGPDGILRDVHEGDKVTSDPKRPLAGIDESDYKRRLATVEDRLAQAQAKGRAALATVTAARATFDRIKALRERESVSQQNYEDTLAKRDAAEAQLDASQREISEASTALQQAEDDLKNCRLSVPISEAVVSRNYIEEGERVQASQPIFQIMDLSRLRVAFGVSDKDISNYRIGQKLIVTADAFPGEHYDGKITKIVPAADLKTRTFEIELTIDQPKSLKPGMVVTIFSGGRQTMTLLPMTAVERKNGKDEYFVYKVVDENGRKIARQCRVKLDGVYDNRIRLLEDDESLVASGDVVVVTGTFRLTDGQAVRILENSDPKLQIDK